MEENEEIIDNISEESMTYSDDSLYNITSFGADMSYRELIAMYKDGDLEKPELQRKYVWTKDEASRFIDSILLGLPVPSIFLAKTDDDKRLIVDGYQRIMTVYDYVERGIFGGDDKVFKLSNTERINPRWRGKAYSELTDEQKRRIRTSPIHAIVFEQKHPQDDTSMYQIFERINTSGRPLKPQEIRNCVYHGKFNQFLFDLNKESIWRNILRESEEDSRMSDVELILRYFAFVDIFEREEINQNQINLVKYLNVYMGEKKNADDVELSEKRKVFLKVMSILYEQIGPNVFRTCKESDGNIVWAKRLNPVVFDAVCTATTKCLESISGESLYDNYVELLMDADFEKVTKFRTTNTENIRKRTNIAARILYGKEI